MRPTGTYLDCFSVISGASAPKLDNYKPQISPKLAPGEAQNLKYWLIFVVPSHQQTYVTMTNRLAANRRTIGLFSVISGAPAPKLAIFGPKFHLNWLLMRRKILNSHQTSNFQVRLGPCGWYWWFLRPEYQFMSSFRPKVGQKSAKKPSFCEKLAIFSRRNAEN